VSDEGSDRPRVRGYAPPIVDDFPPQPEAQPLPRLWLTFVPHAGAVHCFAVLQDNEVRTVSFDPADPIVAQAYAFFVQRMRPTQRAETPKEEEHATEPT
jgi:hypothetical protein